MKKKINSTPKDSSGRKWYQSIRVQLIAAFLSLIIPITALGFFSFAQSRDTIVNQTLNSVDETKDKLTSYLGVIFATVDDSSLRLTGSQMLEDYLAGPTDETEAARFEHFQLSRRFQTYLNENALADDFINNISILTKDSAYMLGTADFSTINLDVEALQSSAWYTKAVENQGRILWSGNRGELDAAFPVSAAYSISAARSVRDFFTGEIAAVLVIDLKTRPIYNIILETNLGENAELHLISPDGRHISSIEEQELPDANISNESFFQEIQASTELYGTKNVTYKGETYLFSYSRVGNTGYILASLVPMAAILATPNAIRNLTLILGALAALFSVLLGLYMSTSMGRTINRLIEAAGKAASGDLTFTLKSRRKDELGILTASLNSMVESIRMLVKDASSISNTVSDSSNVVASTAQQISASSHEVSQAMQEIAKGSSEQAHDAEQSVQSMDVLSSKISEVSENAGSIAKLSQQTAMLTEQGLITIDDLDMKTQETNIVTASIVADIRTLEEQSRAIGKIIKTIDQIADQTNLLALNAAIEAARAGEKGKGFAVVAQEVKKLAAQSMNATKDIAVIISETQKQTQMAVKNARTAEEIVHSQVKAVSDTIVTFKKISESMNLLSSNVTHILDDINEIEDSKNQVLVAMQNVSSISEESAASSQEVASSTEEQLAGVEELAAYAEELSSASETLAATIRKFKLE